MYFIKIIRFSVLGFELGDYFGSADCSFSKTDAFMSL